MSTDAEKFAITSISDIGHLRQDTHAMSFKVGDNQYTLDCLTNMQEMVLIAAEWKQLEQNCGETYIFFQSFDWCHQWCNSFTQAGDEKARPRIKIYILRRNGELVLVWPMMIVKTVAGLDILTFLTEPHGQYGNIICDRKKLPVAVGKRVWKHIRKNNDAVNLNQYPQSSLLKEIIDGDGVVEKFENFASVLDLTEFENWDDYRASLGRNIRKRRNKRRNRLSRLGNVNFEVHFGGTQRYRELVDLALQMKQVWLQKTGRRATVLGQESTRDFLVGLTGQISPTSSLPQGAVLTALTLEGKPIGVEIGMCLDGHYYFYLGAFDWDYRDFTPGKIQIEKTQEWAKNIGLKKFDFLGNPAEYKLTWTNSSTALESRSVPVSMRGFFYCFLWRAYLRPFIRLGFNNLGPKSRVKIFSILSTWKRLKSNWGRYSADVKTAVSPTKTYISDK